MLTYTYMNIFIHQWSKILTRTFNLNLIDLELTEHIFKDFKTSTMSNEDYNKKDVLNEIPSTTGSSVNSWTTQTYDLQDTRYLQQLNQSDQCSSSTNPNIIDQHDITVQNTAFGIASNIVFYQPYNLYFTNEVMMHHNLSRRYIHGQQYEAPVRSRSMEKDKNLDSLRRWETVDGKPSKKPGFIFTLMTYNILAQDLLSQHPHLYNFHNDVHLYWETRWHKIFKEIEKFSPDILCLQEVQESHLPDYFSLLETLGYTSLYKKRTGVRTDGCAVYYKSDVINLVDKSTVEYLKPNISVLNRDNVGLIAKFSPKLHPTREFVVATTHLLYNPRRQDVRIAQMQVLLTEIERMSFNNKTDSESYLPVILTGDLNTPPYSALYNFITKGKLNYENLSPRSLLEGGGTFAGKVLIPSDLGITDNCQHIDALEKRCNNAEKENRSKLFNTGTLSHSFAFNSVYNHGSVENNEGTTFQNNWLTVDYIFYSVKKEDGSENKIKLLSRYRLPTKQELRNIKIPNSVVGSDHLSLIAKFKLEY